jgi:hypothetical protein
MADFHPHTHSNDHPHAHAAPEPSWSLLRLSALGRISIAGGLLAMLWIAVLAVMA